MKDFSKNYVNIYIWRIVSILSGFLSMLIVVPHLSEKPEFYGVYTFCISFTLYLTYADIGFLSSGQKYAAEEYAKGNMDEEIRVLGYISAVLLLMLIPFSLGMIYLAYYPEVILSNISPETKQISKKLFLIIGIATPFTTIFQRLIQSILAIRIKDYVSQRIDVISNLVKIFSVFYFFGKTKYMLVEYFVFITVVTLVGNIITILIIQKYENYNFKLFFQSIILKKKYYYRLKKLALSSLALTLGWVLYYELDLIFIGKLMTPFDVALYSIGFTFLNFLRTLYNSVYAPFYHRFNHFSAISDFASIKKLLTNLVELTMPICITATVLLILSSEYFIAFWVGESYKPSESILSILTLGTLFNFILIPGNHYTIAREKYNYLYIVSITLPLVFVIGVLALFKSYGLLSFSVAKTLALLIGGVIYLFSVRDMIKIEKIVWKWKFQIIILLTSLYLIYPRILSSIYQGSLEKSSTDLVGLLILIFTVFLMSLALFFGSKQNYRIAILSKIKSFLNLT